MDKSQMNDQQIEHLIQSSLFNDAAQVSPKSGTFFTIQDRLGEQSGPGMRQRVSDLSDQLSEAIWRIIPVSKQRMAQALVLVAIAVVVGSYVALAGSDEAVDSGSAAEPTSTVEPTAATVPEATPIAKVTVPSDLKSFQSLQVLPVGVQLQGNAIVLPKGSSPQQGSISFETPLDEQMAYRTERWKAKLFNTRLLLLIYAPGVDPFDEMSSIPLSGDDDHAISVDNYQGGGGSVHLSTNDERLIATEEFVLCGDGRGVYLQHSTKPIEVGETFAWDIYASADDPRGDFHLVSIAESDSPITHDGPDPKRLDIKMTPKQNVISADLGVALVGIIGLDPAVSEMCSN